MISIKKIAAVAVALPLMMVAGTASAELKVAVIRSSDVVQNSPQYRSAEAQIKDEFDKRKTALDAQAKQLAEDIQNYKKNADVMTPDDREKKENELITKQNDLKYQQGKFQQDFQVRDRQMTQKLMSQIKDVITKLAKQKGYDLVLQDPVYAGGTAVDITDEVLKRLKAEAPGK